MLSGYLRWAAFVLCAIVMCGVPARAQVVVPDTATLWSQVETAVADVARQQFEFDKQASVLEKLMRGAESNYARCGRFLNSFEPKKLIGESDKYRVLIERHRKFLGAQIQGLERARRSLETRRKEIEGIRARRPRQYHQAIVELASRYRNDYIDPMLLLVMPGYTDYLGVTRSYIDLVHTASNACAKPESLDPRPAVNLDGLLARSFNTYKDGYFRFAAWVQKTMSRRKV